MSESATFDIGPLSWVKNEIEHSLGEARAHFDKLAQDPGDAKAIKVLATHLHQVTGALSMVGLGAATKLNEEVEALVATFEEPGAKAAVRERVIVARSATVALSNYLDSLMAGEPDRPMQLAPAYMALSRARGGNDASESDLFSPDLTLTIPMADDTVALPKAELLVEAVKQRRGLYQAGLIKLLRERDFVGGTRDMRNAVLAIEALQATSPARAFWFTAGGFFDAIGANANDAGTLAVQLFGKIDQQIKLLIEGVHKVPERLFRDLLLVIGKSDAQTERVRKIRALYRLDELLAAPAPRGESDSDQLGATLRGLRDAVHHIKDDWMRFTSGNRAALDAFSQQGESIAKLARTQPNAGLAELLRVIGLVGPHLQKTGLPPNEVQALEVATALLFAEASLENYHRLGTEFADQSQSLIGRIKGAMSGTPLPALDAATSALMDDMTKRAQERLLMFQVGQEIQINLTAIESALDGFFRDNTKTAELGTLPPLFAQVKGALAILELDEAAALNQILRERVTQFASGALKGTGEDAEAVAEGISALGLYIAGLQQGTSHPREALLPALIRFGLAEKPPEPERSMVKAPVSAADVEVGKQKVQALYEDWRQKPEATTTRDQLRDAVLELKQDAELTGDDDAVKQSEATLAAIEATFDPMKTGVTQAIAEIAPTKPAEAPAPQVVQLIDAPTSEIDEELLDVFLEEATEVLATMSEHFSLVRIAPMDRESLTTIRRGFHTLKGSGRMVGLTDLGEVAWSCEQAMNKWLKEEKPATPALLMLIEQAIGVFGRWVQSLQARATVTERGDELVRLAELLKSDRESEVIIPSVSPASPAEPVEPAVFVEPVVASVPVEEVTSPEVAPEPMEMAEEAVSAEVVSSLDADVALLPLTLEDAESAPPVPAETVVETGSALDFDAVDIFGELPAEPVPISVENVTEASALENTLTDGVLAADSTAERVDDTAPMTVEAIAVEEASPFTLESAEVVEPAVVVEPETGVEDHATLVEELSADALSPDALSMMEPSSPDAPTDEMVSFAAEAATAEEEERDITIGPVTLPAQLYEIYLGEARHHVETLDREMAQIEGNPMATVSHEFMRAAHTLASSSHTTGFESIADVAVALEKWLHTAIELVPEWDAQRLNLTRQVIDQLAGMVLSLHTNEFPLARPDLAEALNQMREALKAGARSGEGTHLKMPGRTDFAPAEPAGVPQEAVSMTDGARQASTSEDAFFAEPEPALDFDPASVFGEPVPPPADEVPADEVLITEVPTIAEAVPAPEEAADVATEELFFEAPPESQRPPIAAGAPLTVSVVADTPAMMAFTPETAPVVAVPEAAAPEAATPFEAGKDRRTIHDDIDPDLLPIFLEEAKELMPLLGDALRAWRAAPANHAPAPELARHLHTLKGSARMAGLMRLGELAHLMETRVVDMDREAAPGSTSFDAIDDRLDRFNAALENLNKGDLSPSIEIPLDAIVAGDVPAELPAPMAMLAAARKEIAAEGERLEGRERASLLRVNADLVDRFVNEAGELAIARSRVDLELQTFKKGLLDLNENIGRMRQQLREVEIAAETQIQSRLREAESQGEQFDPLEFDRFSRMQELTRFLAESLNDVVTLQQSLQKNLDEADAALLQQGRLNRDLQQGLMGVRLVPLGNLQDRFYRIVRQTAKELDKKANLEFRGVRVEIDRSVLEKITAPFEHLLRNAIAHGIETPADRLAAGKSEIGEISIDAQQSGNEVILTLADDGGGLNFDRIRAKAIQVGLLAPDQAATEAELTQFIFAAGFSTAESVSQIAGRGVGMDVVRNEIVSLGGRIDITSTPGRGTAFTIALPLTLAVTQAVLVNVGENVYAIPSVMIEQVQEFKGKRYDPLLSLSEVEWKGNRYPLRSMEVLLGGVARVSAQRKAFVVLAKSGQQRAAVQVDDIIGNREIVVKGIGPQLARIPGIAGATVLGSGQVVLIMNPVQLVFHEVATVRVEHVASGGAVASSEDLQVQHEAELAELAKGPSLGEVIAAGEKQVAFMADEPARSLRAAPLVMVVDDSLTVRKITSRMLQREGFEFATAKDGVDALQQLQDIYPDIILLDIEMPRMDGFEFARNVRADARTRNVPIIMITSRTADKHRNHAMELGVNEYMGKPYQEDQLLKLIRQYTQQAAAA